MGITRPPSRPNVDRELTNDRNMGTTDSKCIILAEYYFRVVVQSLEHRRQIGREDCSAETGEATGKRALEHLARPATEIRSM